MESDRDGQSQAECGPRYRGPAQVWAGQLAGMLLGVLFAWLLAEVLLRFMFFSLPPRLQVVLSHVHTTPLSDSRLLPDPIWRPDDKYLVITRPVANQEQFGSADVRFTVSTEALWGSHAAFRTRQSLVDQHVDAVAVGDSFTFCFTEEEDCWVRRLAELTGRNIINLGITSTGAVSHQRVLADFGLPLRPPLVLWQWFGNDANEDYGLALLRGETDVLSPHPPPPVPERSWLDEHSAFYTLLKLLLGGDAEFTAALQFHDPVFAQSGDVSLRFGKPYLWDAFDLTQPHNLDGWERSRQTLRNARDMVEDYGGTLVVLLVPTKEQVYRELSEPLLGADKLALLDLPHSMMLEFCEAEDLTCLDLLPVLRAETASGIQLYYTTDMHLNARGNHVVAAYLAGWLAEHAAVFDE